MKLFNKFSGKKKKLGSNSNLPVQEDAQDLADIGDDLLELSGDEYTKRAKNEPKNISYEIPMDSMPPKKRPGRLKTQLLGWKDRIVADWKSVPWYLKPWQLANSVLFKPLNFAVTTVEEGINKWLLPPESSLSYGFSTIYTVRKMIFSLVFSAPLSFNFSRVKGREKLYENSGDGILKLSSVRRGVAKSLYNLKDNFFDYKNSSFDRLRDALVNNVKNTFKFNSFSNIFANTPKIGWVKAAEDKFFSKNKKEEIVDKRRKHFGIRFNESVEISDGIDIDVAELDVSELDIKELQSDLWLLQDLADTMRKWSENPQNISRNIVNNTLEALSSKSICEDMSERVLVIVKDSIDGQLRRLFDYIKIIKNRIEVIQANELQHQKMIEANKLSLQKIMSQVNQDLKSERKIISSGTTELSHSDDPLRQTNSQRDLAVSQRDLAVLQELKHIIEALPLLSNENAQTNLKICLDTMKINNVTIANSMGKMFSAMRQLPFGDDKKKDALQKVINNTVVVVNNWIDIVGNKIKEGGHSQKPEEKEEKDKEKNIVVEPVEPKEIILPKP
jgi:hypothetical protein